MMALNSRDAQFRLCSVLHISAMISYTFSQRHPLVCTALVVFLILYIFLSYVFSFLVYIFPFLVCFAIFVGIFWSSEQNLLINFKWGDRRGEKEIVEQNNPNTPKYGSLVRYPSQNATSRRRNFTGRKLDVYGDLEHKAKDLSEVFQNEFTSKSIKFGKTRSFKEGEGYLNYELPTEETESPSLNSPKQTVFFEPSMHDDLVDHGADSGVPMKETEDKKDETEAQLEGSNKFDQTKTKAEEDSNKSGELIEDNQKNDMDLGIAETETTKRLENLIARRRLRRILKLQIEKGLVNMKSIVPGNIAPLSITKEVNPFGSSKEFEVDGIEMPGSAPSLRSPFDIPYDPFEEKPVLTGDSFEQEFTSPQKDIMFTRHESFFYGPSFPSESRNRRHRGKPNHDWLDQLISKQGSEKESKAPNPLSVGDETKHEVDGKCEAGMQVFEAEEAENRHATNSSDWTSEISNVQRDIDSMHESVPSLANKNKESSFLMDLRISHTPSYSLASDLQVEVSEVGSPTLTVDDTITTTDAESMIYDGDIDREVTSGSEDMWGASLHARELRRVSEQDISEVSNWKDIVSAKSLQNLDEEDAADVSSMSSKSDVPEDTPIAAHAVSSDHNMFGNVDYFMGGTTPSRRLPLPSRVSARRKRLADNNHVDHVPDQTHSEKPEEWCNLVNLMNKTQDINGVNNSKTIEQSSSEDHDASFARQETIDEVSINSSSSSSSLRSVLHSKVMADQSSSSGYNQEMHLGSQQSNMEDMAQARSIDEGALDTMPQNIQPLIDDLVVEPHNIGLNHSQDQSSHKENSNQEPILSSKINDTYEEYSNNDENDVEPSRLVEMKISEDMIEKSRHLFNDKVVPLESPMVESSLGVYTENNEIPSTNDTKRYQGTIYQF